MAFMHRRINVYATLWRCIGVETTLPRRHCPLECWEEGTKGSCPVVFSLSKEQTIWKQCRCDVITSLIRRYPPIVIITAELCNMSLLSCIGAEVQMNNENVQNRMTSHARVV